MEKKRVAVVITEEGDGMMFHLGIISENGDVIDAAYCDEKKIEEYALLLLVGEKMINDVLKVKNEDRIS